MPRFEPDPSKVSATIDILEKDDYEFIIGDPKAFQKVDGQGTITNYGVRYPVTVAEGTSKGKKQFQTCYQHTEGAQGFSKQFIMAAYGYPVTPAGEKDFDNDFAGKDWSFDTDTGACGEVWRGIAGKRVIGSADVVPNNRTGDPMQQFNSWRSI
jgi:hypothetical protein